MTVLWNIFLVLVGLNAMAWLVLFFMRAISGMVGIVVAWKAVRETKKEITRW